MRNPIVGILMTTVVVVLSECDPNVPSCRTGHFVGLLVPNPGIPIVLTVGSTITVSSNYGTGTGEQGENCDHVLYTSAERPALFDYVSSDSAVVIVSKDGLVMARAPGKASIHAVANGIDGRSEIITVVPPG